MAGLDWLIVGLYVAIALVLGFYFVRKASHNTADFFVAGRSLPWWIAGTSLVATTFSTDTPLFVAGLARNDGIHGNWFWWAAAIGQTATIFYFAKLWRRTKVLTDVEFIQCRYDPSPQRSVLREVGDRQPEPAPLRVVGGRLHAQPRGSVLLAMVHAPAHEDDALERGLPDVQREHRLCAVEVPRALHRLRRQPPLAAHERTDEHRRHDAAGAALPPASRR